MAKATLQNFDSINFIGPLMLILYLCIGFIPNLEAVDKIAPQWLAMSLLNLISLLYFFSKRISLASSLSLTLKSSMTLIYMGFILWAIGSLAYAINPTEVVVNLSRQLNVFFMFVSMAVFLLSLKNKVRFIPWVITLILGVELHAVFNEALEMLNTSGTISSGTLKGVTANRNITAFSIAIKIPFVLFLIHLEKKSWIKWVLAIGVTLALIALSMIQSRASFVAVGATTVAYMLLHTVLYLKVKKQWTQLLQSGFLIIPLLMAIIVNQTLLSSKGADALSRAATISASTNDGSVNKRLRYYEDVLTHMASNPIFGVGLGNWKLKSIDYDAKDINGYVVPYHAHSDFIQLGAELGILGFVLYLGIFIWAVYYVYRLVRYSTLSVNEKVFLFLLLTALGVYSIDANLNFPIARPQVLVVWTLIMGFLVGYYEKYKNRRSVIQSNKKLASVFLIVGFLFVLPSIYVSNKVYQSLKGQMFLLQDFNTNSYRIPLATLESTIPKIPNITVTTIPINSVKARYFFKAKKYDKALELIEEGTKANPYLFYSELLKSQIYQELGKLDSAKVYARKAFFGLPNNDLHATNYVNLISLTKDQKALEEVFELLTAKNKAPNWKNYLIIASGLYPPKDKALMEKAKRATELFPNDPEFKELYRQIAVGQAGVNTASVFSAKGLEYFNAQDYRNAALEFEKALEANPLDYAHFENAATANYLIGNLEKAEQQIDIVINDLNPLNGKCEYIKALIYIKMGDPIGACPLLATSRDSGYSQAAATFDQYCRY
jgi:O-antigen ligase/Tfp pilus assembly protein PilF